MYATYLLIVSQSKIILQLCITVVITLFYYGFRALSHEFFLWYVFIIIIITNY